MPSKAEQVKYDEFDKYDERKNTTFILDVSYFPFSYV